MTERQIEKPGDLHRRNVLRSLYSIWSFIQFSPSVVEKWLWTDGRKDGRTEGRTDEAVTICSLLGEHDKQYNYCKNQ